MYEDEQLIKALQETGQLFGKFFYSKQQRRAHDMKGTDRFFCKLLDGTITEYTEMVDVETQLENPMETCEYDDAKYLGDGCFHHRESCQ